jgi:hypothetical protein
VRRAFRNKKKTEIVGRRIALPGAGAETPTEIVLT